MTAGYFRGSYDNAVLRLLNVQLAMPFIRLALAILVTIGPSFNTIILLLQITGFTHYGRIVRGEVLPLRERELMTSARAVGAAPGRIILRHLLPNAASLLTVLISLQVPNATVLDSALSFLDLGIQPPLPSRGGMLSDGRQYMLIGWWVAVFPDLALNLVVLGGNLLGDWLHDALDPRQRAG